MKKRVAILLAALMTLSLVGCGKSAETKETTAQGAGTETTKATEEKGNTDPIKIAVVAAMTGSYADYGQAVSTGCDTAVKEWNEKGGINGRQIEMVLYDEKGEREEGLALAQLITGEDDIYGVVGHFMSTTVVGKLYGDARMPLICPTASAEAYSSQSDCTFRLNPTIKVETQAMLQCADTVGKKKLGVVYLNDDWGNRAYKTLEAIFEESNPNGYEIVAAEPILGGDMDYSSVISNLKAAGAETSIMFCYYDSVVPFSIKAAAAYPELNIVCGGSCYNETFLSVGGQDVEGCMAPTTFNAADTADVVKNFVAHYGELHDGAVPSNICAQAYDAMNVMIGAIADCNGEMDREALIAAVRDNNYVGAIGSCAFDENRDAKINFKSMKVHDGAWVACD